LQGPQKDGSPKPTISCTVWISSSRASSFSFSYLYKERKNVSHLIHLSSFQDPSFVGIQLVLWDGMGFSYILYYMETLFKNLRCCVGYVSCAYFVKLGISLLKFFFKVFTLSPSSLH
jgi:hypothetical protein